MYGQESSSLWEIPDNGTVDSVKLVVTFFFSMGILSQLMWSI